MSFAALTDDMDSSIMESLKDGRVDHLAASGTVLAAGVEAIVDEGVERIAELTGFVDRVTTITVRKDLLPGLDRKGGFRSTADEPVAVLDSKTWHIDGIAADDGHLITFYVVP